MQTGTGGGHTQKLFKQCANSGKEGARDGQAENVRLGVDNDATERWVEITY